MEKLVVIDDVCQELNMYIYEIEPTDKVDEDYLKKLGHEGSETHFVVTKVNIY